MKRSIIASVLGIAATMAFANKTQAQGNVFFGNYNGGPTITAPVTFSGVSTSGLVSGENIGYTTGGSDPTFIAQLLYSYGGALGVTYTAGPTATFLTANGTSSEDGGGLFGAALNTVSIPGYTSGAVDFQVEVYELGSTYANSAIRGISGVVQLSALATAGDGFPISDLLSSSFVVTPLTAFTVSPVPEPSSLALAGLGGFGMLMAFRRKKA